MHRPDTGFNFDDVTDGRNGDQAVLRRLSKVYPSLFGRLSRSYDIAIANGAWKYGDRIAKEYKEAGVLHSNGGGPDNRNPYWKTEFYNSHPKGTVTPQIAFAMRWLALLEALCAYEHATMQAGARFSTSWTCHGRGWSTAATHLPY